MSDDLPENWRYGDRHADDAPLYEHEFLHAEVSISPVDGDTDEAYDIWLLHGVPFAASETDFDPPEPITSLDEAEDWAHALMAAMDDAFSPENHHYVGAAMNAVLGTDEYADTGTYSAKENYSCPVCDTALDMFRGMDGREQMERHLEYADDEQHDGVSVSTETRS